MVTDETGLDTAVCRLTVAVQRAVGVMGYGLESGILGFRSLIGVGIRVLRVLKIEKLIKGGTGQPLKQTQHTKPFISSF